MNDALSVAVRHCIDDLLEIGTGLLLLQFYFGFEEFS